MALVWIPPLLRDLTGGSESANVAGANVGEVIDALERQYPGVRGRLCPGGQWRPGLAAVVDGQVGRFGLREAVGPESEVHFLPAIAGG
jgi:molybdopterin synthase sulfur carrier subunit